jgi:hypothetical protein
MLKLNLLAILFLYTSNALAEASAIDENFIKKNFKSTDRLGSPYQQQNFNLMDYEADKVLLERTIETKKAALSLLNRNVSIKAPERANESVYESNPTTDSSEKNLTL